MANKLANRVKMTVSGTPGTGAITLGSAVTGFTDFATGGVVNGNTVPYVIEDGTAWEIGVGTYSSTGPTLTRTTITASSNSNSAISATANAIVMISPLAADLQSTDTLTSGTLPVARGGTGLTTLTAGYIPFGAGTSAFGSSANLFWDSGNVRLGVGTTAPAGILHVVGNTPYFSSANNFMPQVTAWNQYSGSSGPYFILQKGRAASGASAAVSVGDALGTVIFRGFDTTGNVQNSAYFAATATAVGASSVDGAFSILSYGTTGYVSISTNGSERFRIDSAGRFGVGSATSTYAMNIFSQNLTGQAFEDAITIGGVALSDVTSAARGIQSRLTTTAAAFTLSSLFHFYVNPATKGAGSAITNQYGFYTESTLTDATNNYGFYSNIASGTGRWNFYANGTAPNLFAGSTIIGTAALATSATDGFLYIPTCAGAPTGTPTTRTGTVALIYDTTNNNFYIYNGAWKKVALA